MLFRSFITLVEIIGGILSNSLALISDAIHNLSDTLALLLAWIAHKVGKRRPDRRKTFGYQRFEILSAFVNASVLTAVSIYLIYESVVRFITPEPVESGLMLIVALIGLVANLISMIFLHRDSKHSLNVRAAYIHLLGDTLSSVAVVVGALLIRISGLLWIDPLLTLLISLVIIRQAWQILKESTDILMQGSPSHIDLEEIRKSLEQIPGILNIHHVHCWQLLDRQVHFEAHVETDCNMDLHESGQLVTTISALLRENFRIGHTTLQIEFQNCKDQELIHSKGIS